MVATTIRSNSFVQLIMTLPLELNSMSEFRFFQLSALTFYSDVSISNIYDDLIQSN